MCLLNNNKTHKLCNHYKYLCFQSLLETNLLILCHIDKARAAFGHAAGKCPKAQQKQKPESKKKVLLEVGQLLELTAAFLLEKLRQECKNFSLEILNNNALKCEFEEEKNVSSVSTPSF